MTAAGEHLRTVAHSLDHIARLLEQGHTRWISDETIRLAVQRLWIAVGEGVRRYCETADADIQPWAELWAYRNFLAHHVVAEITDDRVWDESLRALERYRPLVNDLLGRTKDRLVTGEE